jgi:hypothetical protein
VLLSWVVFVVFLVFEVVDAVGAVESTCRRTKSRASSARAKS